MSSRILLICLILTFGGCATGEGQLLGNSSKEAPPPYGYMVYCSENPQTEICGGKEKR